MLDYLGRYTHRVAIGNHRIKNIKDGKVTFTAKNRKKNKPYTVTLEAHEFLRRFTLHILPSGFMKIRAFGFLSNTNKREALKIIRKSMNVEPPPEPNEDEPKETPSEKILRLTGIDVAHCPNCKTKFISGPLPLPERPP